MKNLKQLLERMEYTLVQGSVDREITELRASCLSVSRAQRWTAMISLAKWQARGRQPWWCRRM